MIGYYLFAYCLNNPALLLDSEGNSALFAAMIGGAVGGAFVSSISYLVSTAINGESFNARDFLITTAKGAAYGAIGAAIGGVIPKYRKVAKFAASVFLGVESGVSTYKETGDAISAIISGLTTTAGTFAGSLIDAYSAELSNVANFFTNYSVALFTGTVFEIVNVYGQAKHKSIQSNRKFNTAGYATPINNYVGYIHGKTIDMSWQ